MIADLARTALLLLLVACTGDDKPPPADDTGTDTEDTEETDDTVDTEETDTLPPNQQPFALCINEVMADNRGSYKTPDGEAPDWIELHSTADADIDLTGWVMSDGDVDGEAGALDGLTLPAGGFLLLYADGAAVPTADHLPFKLDNDGDSLKLLAPDGRSAELLFPRSAGDMSFARDTDCCDGDCWKVSPYGTPAKANDRGAPADTGP